jgi:hypothetical protein
MNGKANNYAYIDGANLHKGINSLGWKLDYARFRIWLTEKYDAEKAIVVASDGDYASLVNFLNSKQKIEVILSPRNADKCSILLKRTGVKISYLDDQKSILEIQKEKTPDGDETP